ncbi:orotate phosphoribosyltransferase [Thermodesulfobacteriota bacterium]
MSWLEEKEKYAQEIVTLLYRNRMIRTFYRDRPEGWTLISGIYSPLYIQLRPLVSHPSVFKTVCRAMVKMIEEEASEVSRVIGIAMAGVPLAAGMSVVGGIPGGFTRKIEGVKTVEAFRQTIESYGEHSLMEGELDSGDSIAVVDDLVTRFDSKRIAVEQVAFEVRKRGLSNVDCRTVAVALDREQGGQQAAEESGLKLLSVVPFKTMGLPLLKGTMDHKEWQVLTDYLADPDRFQDKQVQAEIRAMAGR